MNIYIKDVETKELYARVRNVDINKFYSILHELLCNVGCLNSCDYDFFGRRYLTIYVDPVDVNMCNLIHSIVSYARCLYRKVVK